MVRWTGAGPALGWRCRDLGIIMQSTVLPALTNTYTRRQSAGSYPYIMASSVCPALLVKVFCTDDGIGG